ncbi:DNA helicase [Colletotrichum musicola]|uniref:DNA helicase n=1 Tax=Colletotrichum musicola TaxID=2175873 RepID=A0A8H6MSW9_9PEZI|nr:DNA helicase [Colletotrichum musicola]
MSEHEEDQAPKPVQTSTDNFIKPCAVFSGTVNGTVIVGLENSTKIQAKLAVIRAPPRDPYIGISLNIPLGDRNSNDPQLANEEAGFGVRHADDTTYGGFPRPIIPCNDHSCVFKFPRGGGYTYTIEEASPEVKERVAGDAEAPLTVVTIKLKEGSTADICGWGKPFSNTSDPQVNGWVNENEPIIDDVTLLGLVRSRNFLLAVKCCKMHADLHLQEARLPPPFEYGYDNPLDWNVEDFDNDKALFTVMTQTPVQDVMWIGQAANEIRQRRFPAYFVPGDPADERFFYVVVRLTAQFRDDFKSAWKRKIMGFVGGIDCMSSHPVEAHELVVRANRPMPNGLGGSELAIKTFPSRPEAEAALKASQDHVLQYRPGSEATNGDAWRIGGIDNSNLDPRARMHLHRCVMGGRGFFDWMCDTDASPGRPLPSVNFFDISDSAFVDAVVAEALPGDRKRFRAYLSDRPLGLGMITAGPGFGKTTALAAAALAMFSKVGEVLVSAPSNVARPSLSVAVWLLALLRSQATCVPDLEPEDKESLHGLRAYVDGCPDFSELREVATGTLPWAKFTMGLIPLKGKVTALMKTLVRDADFLCTTPAMSNNSVIYKEFKDRRAKGVVVDEAANMHRADLACVWGNTLLPCFLGGDPKQLPPAVMSYSEKDLLDNVVHRFADDALISAQEFLLASGYPVYRLKTQLRMANGLFDWIADTVYGDVPYTYSDCCDINLPAFAVGRQLESFVAETYPKVARPPPGKLWPVFIDCVGSFVAVDKSTGSKSCRDQVKVALDFAANFVRAKNVDPARISILAPYSANADLLGKMRKDPGY